jgi:ethanolamine utilization protein
MEITDELVQKITAELWRRIGPEAPAPRARPRLLLAGGLEILSPEARAEIEKHFELKAAPEDGRALPEAEAVLVTSLSIQALVRVAAGDEGCTTEGRALLAALLEGRPAAVLTSGLAWRRYQGTAPRPLLDRYVRCEDVLASYGVKLVDEAEIIAALLGRSAQEGRPAQASAAAPPARNRRRVVNETEVRSLCPVAGGPGQTLKLSPGDILTPLALDYVQSLKIDLSRG